MLNKLTQQNNLILPTELTDIQVEVAPEAIHKQDDWKRNIVFYTILDNILEDNEENVSLHVSRVCHRELDDPKDPILWQVIEVLPPRAAHDTLPIMHNSEQYSSCSIHRHCPCHLQTRVTNTVVDWPPGPLFCNNPDFA